MGIIKNSIYALFYSIMAGIMITIGATIFLSCENKTIGAFLFGIGLLVIVNFGMFLYTGKIGYMAYRTCIGEWLGILVVWIGNFIGTYLTGALLSLTRIGENLREKATQLCSIKLQDDLLSLYILGFFCGMLMFIAVYGYKSLKSDFVKTVLLFLCVGVFILCGFEHSIADMAYFSIAGLWNTQSLIAISFITLGNAFGGLFIPILYRVFNLLVNSQKLDESQKLWYTYK